MSCMTPGCCTSTSGATATTTTMIGMTTVTGVVAAIEGCTARHPVAPDGLRHRPERQAERGTSAIVVGDADCPSVRLHDLAHDGQSEAGSRAGTSLAPPEAVEDPLPVFWAHSWPAIENVNHGGRLH